MVYGVHSDPITFPQILEAACLTSWDSMPGTNCEFRHIPGFSSICHHDDSTSSKHNVLLTCKQEAQAQYVFGFISYFNKSKNTYEEMPAKKSVRKYIGPADMSVNNAKYVCEEEFGKSWHVGSISYISD